ncbi:MAG: 4Fe-4S binding protein, partial [Oscillospiraceae bacterium]
GKAVTNLCVPGADGVAKEIADIMGVAAQDVVEMTGVVACRGCTDKPSKFEYAGLKTCAAAAMLHAGPSSCTYGCLGFGDCVKACQFSAICVAQGIAIINPNVCTGCGKCAQECPKHLITLVPQVENSVVLCSNHDRGAVTRKLCDNGCIGCMKCEKICKNDAIHVIDNCAVIDTVKCLRCRDCEGACPTHAIKIV